MGPCPEYQFKLGISSSNKVIFLQIYNRWRRDKKNQHKKIMKRHDKLS
ncbi:hypothetical protein HanPSC8_Chr15g0677671 [Helianthus annuus]|nr:hypothetical protein HanPSC8_Chr15g0677671 [Helianthus annuus]